MFYQVSLDNREFSAGAFYDGVNWGSLNDIVENFRRRVTWWYLEPAELLQKAGEQHAFPVMALSCILLDSMSQFYFGTNTSSRGNFINFVRMWLPEFAVNLPAPIQHKIDPSPNAPQILVDYAEVLYFAFRCGILHDAHVTPYGMVRGGLQIITFSPNGFTSYVAGGDCPTVLVDPWRILDRVRDVFNAYLNRILDPNLANDILRTQFKFKFSESFGVDVTGAT